MKTDTLNTEKWYWGDSYKKSFSGYSAGQWISLELYSQYGNGKHENKNIGKLSFTQKGGNNETDYKECTDIMELIVTAVNSCKNINKDNPLNAAKAIPELLETLQTVLKDFEQWPCKPSTERKVQNAIINATK